MSPEAPMGSEWLDPEECEIKNINSFIDWKLTVLLFKRKDSGEFRARVQFSQQVTFQCFGRVVGEVFVRDAMVGQGKSPHGACRGLAILIENEIAKWSSSKLVELFSGDEEKLKKLQGFYELVEERIRNGEGDGRLEA